MSLKTTKHMSCFLVLVGVAMLMTGCAQRGTQEHPTASTGESIDYEMIESTLTSFLASDDPNVQTVREDFAGIDLFQGRRFQLNKETWVLGRWAIQKHPRGFHATASKLIYYTEKAAEDMVLQVDLVWKDEKLIVTDWSRRLVLLRPKK